MKKAKEIPVYMNGRQMYKMKDGDLLSLRTYNTISQGFPVKKVVILKGKNEIHIEC